MDQQQPWGYVNLRDYSVISAPVAETARKGLGNLWRRIRQRHADTDPCEPEVDQSASLGFFQELFAVPNWEIAAPSLAALVDERIAAGQTVQTFVGGPHRCTPDVLIQLALSRKWPILTPPAPEQILEGKFDLPPNTADSVLVIPQLAHWFLRHDAGLDLVRSLLDWLHTSRQPAIIGCHSWAWNYLDKVVQAGAALAEPKVLEALDDAALRRWIQQLATASPTKKTVFREASTGKIVLESGGAPDAESPTTANSDASNLLLHIAARSRGIPEVAWSLWRESILSFTKDMLSRAALKAAADQNERTIWTASWAQFHPPEVPSKPGHLALFLKHSLLMHDGLPADILPMLLPFSHGEIQSGLRLLQTQGLVEPDGDRWRITTAGYPSVRAALHNESYLVDSL